MVVARKPRQRCITAFVLTSLLAISPAIGNEENRESEANAKNAGPASRENDVFVFGMSTALSGPAAQLGKNVRAGVDLAFAEANASGGIQGRKLKLIALDDGYEPSRTAPNMHALIESEHVLGVIGNVGTPTAVVSVPIANRAKTLFYGAYTGAGVLRKSPPDKYVINFRASYAEETAEMVDALVNLAGLKPKEIAFFTQRDAYGDAGFVGGITALKKHGLTDEASIAHGRYERNTNIVENGLAEILIAPTPVKAVIMVGAYQPCARFIKLAKESGLEDAMFLNVSFVGAEPLCQELGEAGDGVMITQVVPHPHADVPIVKQFRAAMKEHQVDESYTTFGTLEGYVTARVLMEALSKHNGKFDREGVVLSLENLGQFDVRLDIHLRLSESDHQACHQVWLSVIRNGNVEPYDWNQLKVRGE